VIPLRLVPGAPVQDADQPDGLPVPLVGGPGRATPPGAAR
jgi:hypothetical protein